MIYAHHTCCQKYHWHWVEAFYKFGFNDGDGDVHTEKIVNALCELGYDVLKNRWGLHNTIIYSIRKNEIEILPINNRKYSIGYDDPRNYLPREIIDYLNEIFPAIKEFTFLVRCNL